MKYGPLPSGVKGNVEKMRKAFEMALIYATEQLAEIDFAAYDAVLFISKSVGTAVAAAYANKFAILPGQIYYTPVVESFDAIGQNGIVFHGTADPWAETAQQSSFPYLSPFLHPILSRIKVLKLPGQIGCSDPISDR